MSSRWAHRTRTPPSVRCRTRGTRRAFRAAAPAGPPSRSRRAGGGSAPAGRVAGGGAVFALGTDPGGSIRQPGALTGVAAMKPTYGRVSRYGVVAFASSLDQVGPFGQTVEDCALVCEALFGKDANDATTMPVPAEDLR